MRIDDNGNLTSETFDRIVRDEINRQFYEEYLTDQRIQKLFERIPEKELKEEAYSIFFRSFDDILEGIGIPRDKKMKLNCSWYDYSHHKIDWWRVVDAGTKEDDPQEDIELPFNEYFISFSYKRIKYRMSVTDRVRVIVDYLITKGIFEPHFEAARGYRRKTLEERSVTLPDGRKMIEWDMYDYLKTIGTEIGRGLKVSERKIWHPRVVTRPGDKEREKTIGGYW
jgi:hypothetical protein